ncbi:MAG: hypothetical protein JST16_00820 [Bdellovibrionales bacterium]|nr:hypothetical protein [Bdellovibrionales bacterium]
MPSRFRVNYNARGERVLTRQQIAENFRRILLDLNARWDASFEIAFWRSNGQVAQMPRSHWNMIELGKRKLTLASIHKIARALDLPEHRLSLCHKT